MLVKLSGLRELLKQFGWTENESKAYCALVEHGQLKANDIAERAGIPAARIYGILGSLHADGRILKVQNRPVAYDAQNPRYLVNSHQELLEKQANEVLVNAEQIWDMRLEAGGVPAPRAYTVLGHHGFLTVVRGIIEEAEQSLRVVDSNLEWMRRKDIEALQRFNEGPRRLEIISSSESNETLGQLKIVGIGYKTSKNIKVNFYVADDERVVIRLLTPESAVFMRDENMAKLLPFSVAGLGD